MKKLIFILLVIFNTTNIFATSEDTKLIIEFIKSETKANRDLIIANQKATDKRFDDVNKRFEDMNKRFDTILYIMLSGFTLIFGYLLKERKSMTKEVREDVSEYMEYKLTQKADAKVVENIINVLEKLGNKNPDIAEVLKKHKLE
jgi:hypothetical protein